MIAGLISIIVPVYNSENTLKRCVDSILAQTYQNFELLLIDDGSKDRSGEICNEYAQKDSRVKVFHKENGGVSSARNVGLDNVSGEWITFVDSDDRVAEDYLQNYSLVDNANYDMICQGFETTKPVFLFDNKVPKDNRYEYSVSIYGDIQDAMQTVLESRVLNFLWVIAFKGAIIKEQRLCFDTNLSIGEDLVFIFNYLCYSKNIKGVNKIGYYYAVPEWNLKYIRSFDIEVSIGEQLYTSIRKIFVMSPENKLCQHYREDLTSIYISEFRDNPRNRIRCLKGLRNILRHDFWRSQIFFFTKLVILLDFTYFLSKYTLLAHLSFKRQ